MIKKVGPYRIVNVVGRGGLGVVYRALDDRNGAEVALKLLNQPAADTVAARRLAREFSALREISHRNVVRVLDAGEADDYPYLVMELIDGLPLRSWLDVPEDPDWSPRPPPPPDDSSSATQSTAISDSASESASEAALAWLSGDGEGDSLPPGFESGPGTNPGALHPEILEKLNDPGRLRRIRDAIAQVADALAFIHARGFVHRDVKPSNILIETGGCAKLVDFGLVKTGRSSGNTTATGHVVGTYRYMSPEQARGEEVDARSDLYALGGVLYEMLCGHPAFTQSKTAALLHALVHQPVPPIDGVNPRADPYLGHVAMKLLSKAPADRYQTAEEVARRLRATQSRT